MENLDELMRKKFESDRPAERFEFREEYWEQAQALLEAEEKRRRKRRRWLFWWFFSGGMAVAVAVAVAVGSSSGGGQWAVGRGEAGDMKDAGEQRGGVVKDMTTKEKTPARDPAFANDPSGNQGAGIKKEDRKTAVGSVQRAGKDVEITGIQHAPASQTITPTLSAGKTKPNLPAANRPDTGTEKNTPPPPGYEQVGNAPASDKPADTAATDIATQLRSYNLNALSALPVLLQLLDLPERNLDTPHVPTDVKSIKPAKDRKFSYGLAAAGALSQASPDGKRAGAVGGVFAHYRLAPDWSLTASAQWRYFSGNWANDSVPSESKQLRYSFGSQWDTWHLETLGLHFVEIPVGLRWQRGTFAAEAGLTPALLLGVQGRLTNKRSESLRGNTSDQSRVWLDQKPYNRFLPAAFLGGEWKAAHRLALTLRGTYRPGPIGKKPTDAPYSRHSFWLDAGLRWYFKN